MPGDSAQPSQPPHGMAVPSFEDVTKAGQSAQPHLDKLAAELTKLQAAGTASAAAMSALTAKFNAKLNSASLKGRSMYPKHFVVADLGFGDAGKGQTVHTLCGMQSTHTVVRYNGGCQAGHNVVDDRTGRWHTFSQFGSGTFAGVRTHLSRFMMVEPLSLGIEALSLRRESDIPLPLGFVTVDRDALITTPYHWIVNRHFETRREARKPGSRHGSVGRGVGMTMHYSLTHPDQALRAVDFMHPAVHLEKLNLLYRWCQEILQENGEDYEAPFSHSTHLPDPKTIMEEQLEVMRHVKIVPGDYLTDLIDGPNSLVFEGAQGVLLDQDYGFAPHTTWTNTTMGNADTLLELANADACRLGVTRTYMVRHGPGALPTEADLGVSELHNQWGQWQGGVRTGHLDIPLLQYAIRVATIDGIPHQVGQLERIDGLVLTHIDTAKQHDLRIVHEYRLDGKPWDVPIKARKFPEEQQKLSKNLGETLSSDRLSYAIGGRVSNWPKAVSDALELPVVLMGEGPGTYKVGQNMHNGTIDVMKNGFKARRTLYDRDRHRPNPLFQYTGIRTLSKDVPDLNLMRDFHANTD